MEKQKVSNEGMENTIHSAKQYLGLNQIEGPSEHLIAELRARRANFFKIQTSRTQRIPSTLNLHSIQRMQPLKDASVPR